MTVHYFYMLLVMGLKWTRFKLVDGEISGGVSTTDVMGEVVD